MPLSADKSGPVADKTGAYEAKRKEDLVYIGIGCNQPTRSGDNMLPSNEKHAEEDDVTYSQVAVAQRQKAADFPRWQWKQSLEDAQNHQIRTDRLMEPQSCSAKKSVVLLLCVGATGLGVGGRLGLCPPPPSLSVLEEDGGGGGGSLGRGAEEGGIRVETADPRPVSPRRLWILRHSWQIRTWLQLRMAGAGVGAGGGGVLLAPRGNSRIRWGPGPRSAAADPSAPPPPPPPPSPAPPTKGPAPPSFPLLRRISRTRRRGRGAPKVTRPGWRRAAEPEAGRRRRERELFLQETAFRNSVSIS
ncbi:hypothetical protein N1851_023301 [Merluccius polli]|uniref:Uncharacterized protein n=1 Tax=Merluccius polli TaxID=89951 RepID=A0AA47MGQ8_MERPO|nr:hypothetical protein N1851_023301 [Merluccius polli]